MLSAFDLPYISKSNHRKRGVDHQRVHAANEGPASVKLEGEGDGAARGDGGGAPAGEENGELDGLANEAVLPGVAWLVADDLQADGQHREARNPDIVSPQGQEKCKRHWR